MSVLDLAMFPDRCTIIALQETPGRDATGARVDLFDSPVENVPCSAQEATADDLAVASAMGVKLQTKVYLRTDPGFLRTGSRLIVTAKNGDPVTLPLQVQRVARDNLLDLNLWRADCTGRA